MEEPVRESRKLVDVEGRAALEGEEMLCGREGVTCEGQRSVDSCAGDSGARGVCRRHCRSACVASRT